ncbi:hypothetical protein F511_22217 [Dorcoceras hygrometricum]|uniref:Uncharacterized protein n=1 Tax=Dorcoceras hygrometricum TaxID=472368 RepID=A0A2Z7CF46_9LAMI|nr:hypothetical protein F511_22217 [Dorcoceras hygrometricum]
MKDTEDAKAEEIKKRRAKKNDRIIGPTQEDSGEAFDYPDASNSSIQSKSLFESAVANQPVASFAYSVDLVPRRKELKKEQSAAVVGINQQRSS